MQRISSLIATFFKAGNVGFAPGTFASIIAVGICHIIYTYAGGAISVIAFAGASFAIGVLASDRYILGHQNKDPKEVVIDEIAGQALLFGLAKEFAPNFTCCLAVEYALYLLWFRFFDILKPWPVSYFDKNVKGGMGIMLDDIIAGLMGFGVVLGLAEISKLI